MKKADEKINYLNEEINQNELMSKKDRKVFTILNDIEHLLILVSTVTGCIYTSEFDFLVLQ